MAQTATSRLKVNPPLGTMPVLQFCTLAQLQIDPSYQRSLEAGPSQTLIRRVAQFWNWDLCQPLVVARRDDGGLYVVDGQHRLAAARLRSDIQQLPCVIASYSTPADEAASFVALNQQRRPLSALDLFKAALAAEDDAASAVFGLMKDCGLSVAPHTNFSVWKPGMMSNVSAIASAYRVHGSSVVERALRVISIAYRGQVLRYGGTVFSGVVSALAADHGLDIKRLATVLGNVGQTQFRKAVMERRAAFPNEKYAAASKAVVGELLGRDLGGVAVRGAVDIRRVPAPVPTLRAQPVIANPGGPAMSFCAQCDRRVRPEAVALCQSQVCSLKRRTA